MRYDRSMRARQPVGRPPFHPRQIPGLRLLHDGFGTHNLFQDSARTQPLTAVEQFAGSITDGSGFGNHATQASAPSRPRYSARYNMLTSTETFATWAKNVGASVQQNAGVAPNGQVTASLITLQTGSESSSVTSQAVIVSGASYTFAVWLWAQSGTSNVSLRLYDGSNEFARQNITLTTTPTRYLITGVAGGNHSGTFAVQIRQGTAANSTPFFAWGADLRPTGDGIGMPAYQRVTTDTDYDSAGFLPYLQSDGIDDGMATGNIDLTNTDKATVICAYQGLSLAQGVLVELSNNSDLTSGAFGVHAVLNAGNVRAGYFVRGSGSSAGFAGAGLGAFNKTVVTTLFDLSKSTRAEEVIPYRNSVLDNSIPQGALDAGGGNFGNYPLNLFSRGGTTRRLHARVFFTAIYDRILTPAELSKVEAYANKKTGAY
jgi:hypothetical protein